MFVVRLNHSTWRCAGAVRALRAMPIAAVAVITMLGLAPASALAASDAADAAASPNAAASPDATATADAAAALPTVSVTGIAAGATVSGTVTLGANAVDDVGVTQVKWFVDNVEVGWDGASPWQVAWTSAGVADGAHTVFAKAADAAGGWGTSSVLSFTVANHVSVSDGVAVTSPAAGATVSGTVTLGATAADLSGILQLKWYVDGAEVGWDGGSPWQASWSSTSVANGTHTIFAKAQTGIGIWLASPVTSFTVQNGTPTPTPTTKWQLLVSDDFDGSTLDTTKWKVYGPNWQGNAGNGLRDGRAVSLQNGTLTITAQMLNGVLVSGGVQSRLDQVYGRYEFRVRTDADPSAATSGCVLTWPQSENWPTDGENNIYETTTASRYPFSSFIHYSPQNKQYWFHHYADGTQWHTMAMEWEPDAIRIYRDGALVWTVTDTVAIPDVAHHLVMQLDALKSWMSGSVRMQIDWMRIYGRTV
jgi:beta-glucanase (GH16 family)